MTFRVGQKVVCVDDTWEDLRWSHVPFKPVAGRIYTIRDILDWWNDGDTGFRLAELVNPLQKWGRDLEEACFWGARFRPVVERETDISIFTRMLNPSRENMDA